MTLSLCADSACVIVEIARAAVSYLSFRAKNPRICVSEYGQCADSRTGQIAAAQWFSTGLRLGTEFAI